MGRFSFRSSLALGAVALGAVALGSVWPGGPALARYRVDDSSLFLNEIRAGRVELGGQGTLFSVGADTTHLEAAGSLKVGLNDRVCFEFSYPYLSQSQGAFSKSGQGDLVCALSYHQALPLWPGLHAGLRQSLIFPSGFRQELAGFDEFTTGRSQSETLLLLEQAGAEGKDAPLWLALNAGMRTDSHRENTKFLWGAAFRYQVLPRWLYVESELAQELDTGTKEMDYQFSAGAGLSLPMGFELRAGAQERVLYNLDRFGLYAGLAWSHQPVIPVRIRHRHLQPLLQQRLDAKNKVPSFTLEPGAPPLLAEAGRLPFLPLKVLVLPFIETDSSPVAARLAEHLRRTVEEDSSFALLPEADLTRALESLHLNIKQIRTDQLVNELGRALGADLVLRGQVLAHEPRGRKGISLKPLFARSRQAHRLEAQVWLHEVDQASSPRTVRLASEAEGPVRWLFLKAEHGEGDFPEDARVRSDLTRQSLERWCRLASDALMYESTEQVVVDK